jgi:hypothetical protein
MTDQKKIETMEYFKYLGRFTTIDTRSKHESKSRMSKARAAFNKKKEKWTAI